LITTLKKSPGQAIQERRWTRGGNGGKARKGKRADALSNLENTSHKGRRNCRKKGKPAVSVYP